MKARVSHTGAVHAKTKSPFFNKEKGQGFFNAQRPVESGFFRPAGNSATIQAKLTVGKPNDIYEKEADSMADKVVQRLNEPSPIQKMSMPPAGFLSSSGLVQEKCASCEHEKLLQKKPIFESETESINDRVQRKCAACEQDEKLQKKPIFESGAEQEKEKAQRKPSESSAHTVHSSVESSISSSKGSGSPLPKNTRRQMESSFGADFSAVRIHDNSAARQMSKNLNAQAFAHGKDIYFNSGKYDPGSRAGRHLLAHELTHVVQQNNGLAKKADIRTKLTSDVNAHINPGNHSSLLHHAQNTPHLTNGYGIATENKLQKKSIEEKETTKDDLPQNPEYGMKNKPPEVDRPGLISRSPLSIQRAVKDDPNDIPKLNAINAPPEGNITWNEAKSRFEMTLTGFKVKKYLGHETKLPADRVEKPKPGSRKTKQGKLWREKTEKEVKARLDKLTGSKNESDNFLLKIKGKEDKKTNNQDTGGGKDGKQTQVIGNTEGLAKAIIVPFWDKKAEPTIHQIEHVLDWQILGDKADNIDNLILLDKETNLALGNELEKNIRNAIQAIMKAYSEAPDGLLSPIATGSYDTVTSAYNIYFEKLKEGEETKAKSVILRDELVADAPDIISDKTLEIRPPEIPSGHCMIKTAISGIGYIVPYNYKKGNIEIKGDPKAGVAGKLISIQLLKIIDGGNTNITGGNKPLDLEFKKEGEESKPYYRLITRGYAAVLQESIKLVGLSPIEFSEEVEVNPLTGFQADGKVKPDISLLKDADIDFSLENGGFSVTGTIESNILKDKLPKPLGVDYSDLSVTVSTKQALAVGGEIGFSIKDLGRGNLSGIAGTKGFGIGGKFIFDNAQSFKKAEIGFKYFRKAGDDEGKWEGNGQLVFEKDVVPGVKKADIKISYKDEILSGEGTAELSIPGFKNVTLKAQFDAAGNFVINGKADLKNVPGIKNSNIDATITKEGGNYSLAIAGTAVPDLPKIPGLGASFTVSYDKGVFKLEGTATYKQGKLDGSATVGVTNAAIDENGVPSKESAGDKLRIYGSGTIKLDLVKGADVTLHAAVNEKGSMFVWGAIDINAKPFDPVDIDKQIFKIDNSIPLVGVPFVNVNLRIGAGARFYFHWDPLTIEIHTTLDKTNIEDLDEAGGQLTAKLSSNAKAGIELSITAGVGITVTVITVSANMTGSVALEINAELGAEAAAKWNVKNGLQLESADAYLKATPSVIFKLAGDVRAELDLLISKTELYKKELGSVQKQLDLSKYAFGVKVPLKIDDNGKIKGIDFDKLTIEPQFNADAGNQITDQALNDDKKGENNKQEEEAKAKIQKDISDKLRAKKAEGADLSGYISQLREDTLKNIPPALAGFVDQSIQNEINKIRKEEGGEAKAADTPPPDDHKDDASNTIQTKQEAVNAASGMRASGLTEPASSSTIESNLDSSKGSGSPLPQDAREKMESAFGADFSRVSIHNDSAATQMNEALNAQAFTHGSDIYFNAGKYDTNSKDGGRLLAHELTHVVQQQNPPFSQQKSIHKSEKMIQAYPNAAQKIPNTDKQKNFFSHRNEIVDIQGKSSFNPGTGLGIYISSLWENGEDAPVNIKFGALASGFIWVSQTGSYDPGGCVDIPFGLGDVFEPFDVDIKVCNDKAPEITNYHAVPQVIPFKHESFRENTKGSLVLLVSIISGTIFGKLGWIEGKKADDIEPLMDAISIVTEPEAFLPFIYGDQYNGKNYTSFAYQNILEDGRLSLHIQGELALANQQIIYGDYYLLDDADQWTGELQGQAKGLEDYRFPINRSHDTGLFGDFNGMVLDKKWTSPEKENDKDSFIASGQLRASYKNGVFDFFGKATYVNERFNGEVSIAITRESEAQRLFEEHAPAIKEKGKIGAIFLNEGDGSEEPLALTAWGNLSFKLIEEDNKASQGKTGSKSSALQDLVGHGAFVVSSDGYIILAGEVIFPTKWLLTGPFDYRSDDPDNSSKHLFQTEIIELPIPVPPLGSVELSLGTTFDLSTHLDPVQLYEIEISGVYSNHPKYRSEVGLTPRLYIAGHAAAHIAISIAAKPKALGIFEIGKVEGELNGLAKFDAYINAAPTIKRIWEGKENPAKYAISGLIQAGGKLTFALSGDLSIEVLKKQIAKTHDFKIASWTLGNFGLQFLLNEYIIGSGDKINIDYSKINFGRGQRKNLANAIIQQKEAKGGTDQQSGGFEQMEGKKSVEKGEFSSTPPQLPDKGAEKIDHDTDEEFLMEDTLHELILHYTGTRDSPEVLLEMSSDVKQELEDKITKEKETLEFEKVFVSDTDTKSIEMQEDDLTAIENEAKDVKKNASETAKKVTDDETPVVAGFEPLKESLQSYGTKYEREDLGVESKTIPQPASLIGGNQQLCVPKTGASSELGSRLKEKREEVGHKDFEDFKGSNVAVFRYYVLRPGAKKIDENASGPFYEAAVNVAKELHSEQIIVGMLDTIHKSRDFRKEYGPDFILVVDQILSERSPCSICRDLLQNNPSSLIITSNFHTHFVVEYSGNWIERNRALMLRYCLTPPALEDLKKKYGGGSGKPDPE